MTCFVLLERAFRILDLKDSEVVILLVEFFEKSSVNVVFELGDSQILNLNRVSHGPVEADWNGAQVVRVLD